jgi:hypothetical protein
VDVVGKYRYEAREPLGGPSLPLLLDVLLVGRTKMLRLHSCLWLENATSLRLEPCLQLGSGCSMPVVLGPGDKLDSQQRLHLRVGALVSFAGMHRASRLPCNASSASAAPEPWRQ